MSTELTKNLYCVQMRTGVEIWVEEDRASVLQGILLNISSSKFILFEDQTINTADIVGVFPAKTMEEATRRKNGEFKCKSGNWHTREESCNDCKRTLINKELSKYQS